MMKCINGLISLLFGGLVWSFVALSLGNCSPSHSKTDSAEDVDPVARTSDTIQLLFTGDIMYHMPQLQAARLPQGGFDFWPSWEALQLRLERADVVIGNLETTLHPTRYSGYPRFSTPDTLAYTLKRAGFSVLTTANNHAADRGKEGIEHTIAKLQQLNLYTTGTFLNDTDRQQRAPLLVERKGIRVAFLAYSYSTNGMPVPPPCQVALLADTTAIKTELNRAKAEHADLIVVLPHWGIEYQTQPSVEQKRMARWLQQHGADAIVGSHPHVCQPLLVDTIQLSNNPSQTTLFPVFYSLGNLISNQSKPVATQHGFLAQITIIKERGATIIIDCKTIPTFCYRKAHGKNGYFVLPLPDADRWQNRINTREFTPPTISKERQSLQRL